MRVENIPGNSGVTGTNAIAAAPRDGSVVGLAVSTAIIGGKLLSRSAQFNPSEDFVWLAILGTYPNAMLVSGKSPWRTLDHWLADARQGDHPDGLRVVRHRAARDIWPVPICAWRKTRISRT